MMLEKLHQDELYLSLQAGKLSPVKFHLASTSGKSSMRNIFLQSSLMRFQGKHAECIEYIDDVLQSKNWNEIETLLFHIIKLQAALDFNEFEEAKSIFDQNKLIFKKIHADKQFPTLSWMHTLLRAKLLIYTGNYTEGRVVIEEKGTPASSRSPIIKSGYHYILGQPAEQQGKFEDAIIQYNRALEILEDEPQPYLYKQAQIYKNLGTAYFNSSNYERALKYLQQSQNLVQTFSYENPVFQAKLLHTLGTIMYGKEEYEQAIKDFEEGLFLLDSSIDSDGDYIMLKAAFYNNLAVVYHSLGNLEKNIEMLERSLELKRKLDNSAFIITTLINLGKRYRQLGNFEVAKDYLHEAVENAKEEEIQDSLATAYNNLSAIYSLQGDFEKSIQIQKEGLEINENISHKPGISANHEQLGLIKRQQGSMDEALTHLKRTLALHQEMDNPQVVLFSIFNIIELLIDMGKNKKEIENYYTLSKTVNTDHLDRDQIDLARNLIDGFVFSIADSPRKRMKGKSLLADMMEKTNLPFQYRIKATFRYIELLLHDFDMTTLLDYEKVLDQILDHLQNWIMESSTIIYLPKLYWLMSKLAILNGEIESGQKYLYFAFSIIEEHDLRGIQDFVLRDLINLMENREVYQTMIREKEPQEIIQAIKLENSLPLVRQKRFDELSSIYPQVDRQTASSYLDELANRHPSTHLSSSP